MRMKNIIDTELLQVLSSIFYRRMAYIMFLFFWIGCIPDSNVVYGSAASNKQDLFFDHFITQQSTQKIDKERFEQDLKLIAGLIKLEDRIISLSIFKRYYVQDVVRLEDELSDQLREVEEVLKKALFERKKREFAEQYGKYPTEKNIEEKQSLEELKKQSLQEFTQLSELAPDEAMNKIRKAEKLYVHSNGNSLVRNERRIFFEWALEKLQESKDALDDSNGLRVFKRRGKKLLIALIITAIAGVWYSGYRHFDKPSKKSRPWDDPLVRLVDPVIIEYFSKHFEDLSKAYNEGKKIGDSHLTALSQKLKNPDIFSLLKQNKENNGEEQLKRKESFEEINFLANQEKYLKPYIKRIFGKEAAAIQFPKKYSK